MVQSLQNGGLCMKYNENLKTIKANLIEEAKKMLPLSYEVCEADSFWSVHVDKEGKVEADGYAQESGIYIGKSIEDLSLSDIALLIDNKLETRYAE